MCRGMFCCGLPCVALVYVMAVWRFHLFLYLYLHLLMLLRQQLHLQWQVPSALAMWS